MQTKVIYLSGDATDELKLNEAAQAGYRLQTSVISRGQIVGYLVREPWANEKPLATRDKPAATAIPSHGASSTTAPLAPEPKSPTIGNGKINYTGRRK